MIPWGLHKNNFNFNSEQDYKIIWPIAILKSQVSNAFLKQSIDDLNRFLDN